MFEPGTFVAQQIEPIDTDQIQPNGVDLTLGSVFEQVEPGRIAREGKTIGERREREAVGADDAGVDDAGTYTLSPGGHIARYGETVRIPEGHVGFVYPRSSLMRNSCMLHTAVWDAGYEGRGEGLLEVHHEVEIERGARIAQFVLAEADHTGAYDGSYQEEHL